MYWTLTCSSLAVFRLGDQQSGSDLPDVTCYMSSPYRPYPFHFTCAGSFAWPGPVVKGLERGAIEKFHSLVGQNPGKSMDEVGAHPHVFHNGFHWLPTALDRMMFLFSTL